MCIPPKRRPAKWKAKRGRPVVARKNDYQQQYKVDSGQWTKVDANERT